MWKLSESKIASTHIYRKIGGVMWYVCVRASVSVYEVFVDN